MSKWVEFNPSHARQILEIDVRPEESWASGEFSDNWFSDLGDKVYAMTLMAEEKPVACAGLVLLGRDKAEAWVLLSNSFHPYVYTLYKGIKEGLINWLEVKKLRRIQATIDPYPKVVNWIEHLGFQYEGRLRNYGPQGQDYLMYSRVA